MPNHWIRILRGYSHAYPGYIYEKAGGSPLHDVRADGTPFPVYGRRWRSEVGFPTSATAWYGLGRNQASVSQASLYCDGGSSAYASFVDPVRPADAGLATSQ